VREKREFTERKLRVDRAGFMRKKESKKGGAPITFGRAASEKSRKKRKKKD